MVWLPSILFSQKSWECHHPNWLSYFSEGWPAPTNQIIVFKSVQFRWVVNPLDQLSGFGRWMSPARNVQPHHKQKQPRWGPFPSLSWWHSSVDPMESNQNPSSGEKNPSQLRGRGGSMTCYTVLLMTRSLTIEAIRPSKIFEVEAQAPLSCFPHGCWLSPDGPNVRVWEPPLVYVSPRLFQYPWRDGHFTMKRVIHLASDHPSIPTVTSNHGTYDQIVSQAPIDWCWIHPSPLVHVSLIYICFSRSTD